MDNVYDLIKSELLNFGYDLKLEDVKMLCDRFGIVEHTAENIEFLVDFMRPTVEAQQQQRTQEQEGSNSNAGNSQATIERVKAQIYEKAISEADQISALIIQQPVIVQNQVMDTVKAHKEHLRENPRNLPLFVHLGIMLGREKIAAQTMVICVLSIAMFFLGTIFLVTRYDNGTNSQNSIKYQRIY